MRPRDHLVRFVSLRPGAVDWAKAQGLPIDCQIEHLNPTDVQAGDRVIGSLPVNLAADVCARGARYLHLALELSLSMRGLELGYEDLIRLGARLLPYRIEADD